MGAPKLDKPLAPRDPVCEWLVVQYNIAVQKINVDGYNGSLHSSRGGQGTENHGPIS